MFHSWRTLRKTVAQTIVVTRASVSSAAVALRSISSRWAWIVHMCRVFVSSSAASSFDSHSRTSLKYHAWSRPRTSPQSSFRISPRARSSRARISAARSTARYGLPTIESWHSPSYCSKNET